MNRLNLRNSGGRATRIGCDRAAGFTLVELIVGSALLSIIFLSIYSTFSTSMRAWRVGESDMAVLQEARESLGMMSRELQNAVNGSYRFIEATDDSIEFIANTPSMDLSEGEGTRVLWIRYDLRRERNASARTFGLRRTEALVEGQLPAPAPPGEEENAKYQPDLGRKQEFVIASGVTDLRFTYYWMPPPPERPPDTPPEPLEPMMEKKIKKGWGLPQGMEIRLTVEDPLSDTGETTLTTYIAFHAPSTPAHEDILKEYGYDK